MCVKNPPRARHPTALTPTETEEKLKISKSMPSIFMQQCILKTVQTMARLDLRIDAWSSSSMHARDEVN